MSEFIERNPLLVISILKIVVVMGVLMTALAYIVWFERKLIAHIQVRWGPYRVGPHGLLQPLADALKFLFKEDPTPAGVDKTVYFLAPFISLSLAITAIAIIPFGPRDVTLFGHATPLAVTDLSLGLLILIAITSLGVYGIALAGWSSNSKYPLLGGLRSSAQMVSYELSLSMSVIGVLLVAGTFNLREIVTLQQGHWMGVIPRWNIFAPPLPQLLGFFCFFAAAVAETNRVPFDLPEAESELVGGFHTEYSGFRFSLYFLAEYAAMVLVSSIAVTLFLGGWLRPFASVGWLNFLDFAPVALFAFAAFWCGREALRLPARLEWRWQRLLLQGLAVGAAMVALALLAPQRGENGLAFRVLEAVQGVFWFVAKVCAFIYGFIWFRGTFPRYRFDQLMNLGWHFMIPLAIVNVIFAGLALVASRAWGWNLAASLWLGTAATLVVAVPLARRTV